mgnify:CR=1 FL=1
MFNREQARHLMEEIIILFPSRLPTHQEEKLSKWYGEWKTTVGR